MAGVAGAVGLAALYAAKRELRRSLKAALNSMTVQERERESQALVRKVRWSVGTSSKWQSRLAAALPKFAIAECLCEILYMQTRGHVLDWLCGVVTSAQ